jgi:hypothetical protein
MPTTRPLAAALAASAILAAAGCGDGGSASAGTTATAPATTPAAVPVPTSPLATFVWDNGTLRPPRLQVPRVPQVTLVLIAADGRDHEATIASPLGTKRIRVAAGERQEVVLSRLRPGAQYRVVPAGGGRAAVLQVG